MDTIGLNERSNITKLPLDRRKSTSTTGEGDQGDTCRICRGEGTIDQPLFYPCKCSGSIKFVHQDCLMEWLSHSKKKYCELCKTPFRFTKLYDKSMPTSLPTPLFLKQVGVHVFKTLARWLRYILVTFIWTCVLPWSIRQIWRGLFWLADGSWMTAHEMKQLTSVGHADTFTDSNVTNNSIPTHGATLSYFDPIAELFNLLTGAPLLRGLLRLLTPNTLPHHVSPLELNATTQSETEFSQFLRQPSLLSDVSSLNSMTKYPVVNNSLIDILEGQVVCLSVIAAFILVFLIREWVINQQPILNMPNPDRADAQPAPAAPINEARRPVRQRRGGLRRLPDRGLQQNGQHLDMPQRPTAIPRPRRAATDENLTLDQTPEQALERIQLPPRSSSLIPDSTSGHDVFEMDMDDNTLWHPQSHPGPPTLQRGMFDEVVDIRRNIEERITLPPGSGQPGVDFYNIPELQTLQNDPTSLSAAQRDGEVGHDLVQRTDFVFGRSTQVDQPNRTAASQFTFSSPIGTGDIDRADGEAPAPQSDETASSNPDSPWESLDELQHAQAAVPITDPLQTVPVIETTADQNNAEDSNRRTTAAIEIAPLAADDDDDTPDTVYDRIVNWMWHTDEQTPPQLPELEQAEQAIMANAHGGHALQAGNANAVNPPAPAAPAHEPNIQFGIDLNDPNALDDAEDLEGILELIGMEGPIAGMIQNIIFSVFLITLTLSASVWCPYIWGKIAILVLSNPIGVFVKAPLFFVSRCGNIVIDTLLFMGGLIGFGLFNIAKLVKLVITPILPSLAGYIKVAAIEGWSYGVSQKSGARLEKALSGTFFGLRPDLPTFSMQSHHALRVFRQAGIDISTAISGDILGTIKSAIGFWQTRGVIGLPMFVIDEFMSFPGHTFSAIQSTIKWWHVLANDLRMPPLTGVTGNDTPLVEWTTEDKILAVIVGYVFFALAGFAYLKIAHLVLGLNKTEKVDGMFADSLRQAGGVLKVIVIIGIEMIAFPLYCGSLLDCALLPLFESATFQSRLDFLVDAPITCLFIHWFVGTCYMFHFALFVSMCRKIMRKGVLYFIRDPDDPTFHPVRDVLERPVTTQLGKIAFSACVYGGLVIVCLGGVVWSISSIGSILPVHWSTSEPRLAFPVDIIFYNFMLPFIVKRAEPSKRISTMYEWWFRRCARFLRLSHFLFNEEREDEKYETQPFWKNTSDPKIGISAFLKEDKQHDGRYVRVPAADSVRIPKGTRAFVEVNEKNERIDGVPDRDDGLHGRKDERFVKIWVPSNFRARIVVFVFLVWLFAASTGVVFTTLPLVVGRQLIRWAAASSSVPNDLYAFTVGLHVCGVTGFAGYLCISRKEQIQSRATEIVTNTKESLPHLYRFTKYTLGLVYLFFAVFIALPFTLSLLTELYIHMPIYSYFASNTPRGTILQKPTTSTPTSPIRPTIFILQTWTLGLLYLRVALRVVISSHNRPSTAIRAIVRNGYLQPDVSLASRALIFPALTLCIVLLAAPIGLAKVIIVLTGTTDPQERLYLYRSSFPVLLGLAVSVYVAMGIQHKIEGWRVKVRDEVYLVGERLHNFTEPAGSKKKTAPKVDKGKGRAVEPENIVASNVAASIDADVQEAQIIGHQFQDSEDVLASGSSVH